MPLAVRVAAKIAVDAKLLATLTVKVCVPVVPKTVFPEAVRVLLVLASVRSPAKRATPELSMVRRSTS